MNLEMGFVFFFGAILVSFLLMYPKLAIKQAIFIMWVVMELSKMAYIDM